METFIWTLIGTYVCGGMIAVVAVIIAPRSWEKFPQLNRSPGLDAALQRQWEGFKAEHGCYPNELRKPWNLKLWFNQRFPYYRLCFHRWCLRFQTYDHRCERHQDD